MDRNERHPGDVPSAPAAPGSSRGVDRGDRVHEFRGGSVRITWSRRRCTHVAKCVLHLPTVFEPGRRPWVDAAAATADDIARVVARCPTGALHCWRTDGSPSEAIPAENTVRVARHGPLYVHGDIELRDELGAVRLADMRMALCRCGSSENRPLCDGTHAVAGFRDSGAVHRKEAAPDAAPSGQKLRVRPLSDGPLLFEGPFTIVSADGGTLIASGGARLCRCGHSQTRPFCDGSHERTGWKEDGSR